MTRILTAPAKINLTLDVLRRREDGYHDIATVMLALTLADEITLERAGDGIEVNCGGFDTPEGEGNIAYQAAALCLEEWRLPGGCRVHIEKNIPAGAGLGGASSDAAVVINWLAGEAGVTDPQERRAIAARIGSDVSFFIEGGCALATGRGEVIELLPIPDSISVVLAYPGEPVSTRQAYAQIVARGLPVVQCASSRMADLIRSGASWRHIASALANDFENVVLPDRSDIVDAKRFLIENGALGALLAGSGGAVFGVFDDREHARVAADLARVNFGWAAAAETARR